jgi:protein O-GlcNAc transferase
MRSLNELITAIHHFQEGKVKLAREKAEDILEKEPDNEVALLLMGNCAFASEEHEEAIECYNKSINTNPAFKDARLALGDALKAVGRNKEAVEAYKLLLDLTPGNAAVLLKMGECLVNMGANNQAEKALRMALGINPGMGFAHVLLGRIARDKTAGVDEAIGHCLEAIKINAQDHQAYNEMGNYLMRAGDPVAACRCFKKILDMTGPETAPIYSNWLLAQHYRDDITPEELFENHRGWQKRHDLIGRTDRLDFPNTPDPDRKIKVGFTSGDLYSHSVFFFLNGLFREYDRSRFEFICFSDLAESTEDKQTLLLKSNVDGWHRVIGLNAGVLTEKAEEEKIDILVDLSGHTGHNRLLAYLKRSAPVQVTWLGYADTTGLDTIDYRLIDSVTDPEPWADKLASETLYRLPTPFLCYDPGDVWEGIVSQRKPEPGKIVFGTFNEAPKFSPSAVRLWCEILKRIPEAELVIKCRPFGEHKTKEFMLENLAKYGIQENRVKLLGFIPSNTGHISTYDVMDVALDPFPYNGTTTSCEAMWMGVPFITREGDRHCARVGMSLLKSVGLDDWIAYSDEEYVEKAVMVSKNPDKLWEVKRTLRQKMQESALCDSKGFAKKFCTALRTMWEKWCHDKISSLG